MRYWRKYDCGLRIADFQSPFIAFFLPPRSFQRAALIIDLRLLKSAVRDPQLVSARTASGNASRACLTPRITNRTSAPPFERRHQKSDMRPSLANLAGLPLATSGGCQLNRHLSYHNLQSYLALPCNHQQLRPGLWKLIILKLADNDRSRQPGI